MFRYWLKQVVQLRMLTVVGALVSLAFYSVGLHIIFIICLAAILVLLLPYPKYISTLFSRLFISLFIIFGLLQVGSLIQFLLLPKTDFNTLAILTALLFVPFMLLLQGSNINKYTKNNLINKVDVCALLTTAVYFIPMVVFMYFATNIQLASFGGIQGVDGVNHYSAISSLSKDGHLDYAPGSYYPKGFHIATAFIQNSIGLDQSKNDWRGNALTYVGQYIVFGSALLISLYYLFIVIVKRLINSKYSIRMPIYIGAAISLSATVAIFYLSNFLYHGFLSYFYISATIIIAFIYIMERAEVKKNIDSRYLLSIYLLLILGASASWPLLTPTLLLIGALFFLSEIGFRLKRAELKWYAVFLILIIFNLLPVYFQLIFAGADASQGINLTGGLTIFHSGLVLLGIVTLCVYVFSGGVTSRLKLVIQQLYIPMFILIIGLAMMQYFVIGEIRYYTIKSSLLLELLIIVLLIAILVKYYPKLDSKTSWYPIVVLPILTSGVLLLILAISGNPLIDARNLIRNFSNQPLPAYFNNDVNDFASLGSQKDLINSNSISLHVNDQNILFTHTQIYLWANVMSFDGTEKEYKSLECGRQVNIILFSQNFSEQAQKKLISKVKECSVLAKNNQLPYYIVTDDRSAPYIRGLFESSVVIVK